MPRPKNNELHNIYLDNGENEVYCNNDKCNNKKLSKHTGNLERHLKLYHPKLYAEYIQKKCASKAFSKTLKTTVRVSDVNRNNIEQAIVELFTKNGRPLHMAEDRAFKVLVQPVFDALGITVNEHNVIEKIIAFSNNIKEEIIGDLNKKLISLKIDAATRQDLSVLEVNVQYIKNKCIHIKTLAVKELKASHTGEYLKSIILGVLQDYNIDLKQIISITTDNGANMIKAAKNLNNELQTFLDEDEVTVEEEYSGDNQFDSKIEELKMQFTSMDIIGVHCSADTIQLCVHDVITTPYIKMKLDLFRSIVKKLLTQNYFNILKSSNSKKTDP